MHCLREFKNDNKTQKLAVLNNVNNKIFLLVGMDLLVRISCEKGDI